MSYFYLTAAVVILASASQSQADPLFNLLGNGNQRRQIGSNRGLGVDVNAGVGVNLLGNNGNSNGNSNGLLGGLFGGGNSNGNSNSNGLLSGGLLGNGGLLGGLFGGGLFGSGSGGSQQVSWTTGNQNGKPGSSTTVTTVTTIIGQRGPKPEKVIKSNGRTVWVFTVVSPKNPNKFQKIEVADKLGRIPQLDPSGNVYYLSITGKPLYSGQPKPEKVLGPDGSIISYIFKFIFRNKPQTMVVQAKPGMVPEMDLDKDIYWCITGESPNPSGTRPQKQVLPNGKIIWIIIIQLPSGKTITLRLPGIPGKIPQVIDNKFIKWVNENPPNSDGNNPAQEPSGLEPQIEILEDGTIIYIFTIQLPGGQKQTMKVTGQPGMIPQLQPNGSILWISENTLNPNGNNSGQQPSGIRPQKQVLPNGKIIWIIIIQLPSGKTITLRLPGIPGKKPQVIDNKFIKWFNENPPNSDGNNPAQEPSGEEPQIEILEDGTIIWIFTIQLPTGKTTTIKVPGIAGKIPHLGLGNLPVYDDEDYPNLDGNNPGQQPSGTQPQKEVGPDGKIYYVFIITLPGGQKETMKVPGIAGMVPQMGPDNTLSWYPENFFNPDDNNPLISQISPTRPSGQPNGQDPQNLPGYYPNGQDPQNLPGYYPNGQQLGPNGQPGFQISPTHPSGNEPSGQQPGPNGKPIYPQNPSTQPNGQKPENPSEQPNGQHPQNLPGYYPNGQDPQNLPGYYPNGQQLGPNGQPGFQISPTHPSGNEPSGQQPGPNGKPIYPQNPSTQPNGQKPENPSEQPNGQHPQNLPGYYPNGQDPQNLPGYYPNGQQLGPNGQPGFQISPTHPSGNEPSGQQPGPNGKPIYPQNPSTQPNGQKPENPSEQPNGQHPQNLPGYYPNGQDPQNLPGYYPNGQQLGPNGQPGFQISPTHPSGNEPSGQQPGPNGKPIYPQNPSTQPNGQKPENPSEQPNGQHPQNLPGYYPNGQDPQNLPGYYPNGQQLGPNGQPGFQISPTHPSGNEPSGQQPGPNGKPIYPQNPSTQPNGQKPENPSEQPNGQHPQNLPGYYPNGQDPQNLPGYYPNGQQLGPNGQPGFQISPTHPSGNEPSGQQPGPNGKPIYPQNPSTQPNGQKPENPSEQPNGQHPQNLSGYYPNVQPDGQQFGPNEQPGFQISPTHPSGNEPSGQQPGPNGKPIYPQNPSTQPNGQKPENPSEQPNGQHPQNLPGYYPNGQDPQNLPGYYPNGQQLGPNGQPGFQISPTHPSGNEPSGQQPGPNGKPIYPQNPSTQPNGQKPENPSEQPNGQHPQNLSGYYPNVQPDGQQFGPNEQPGFQISPTHPSGNLPSGQQQPSEQAPTGQQPKTEVGPDGQVYYIFIIIGPKGQKETIKVPAIPGFKPQMRPDKTLSWVPAKSPNPDGNNPSGNQQQPSELYPDEETPEDGEDLEDPTEINVTIHENVPSRQPTGAKPLGKPSKPQKVKKPDGTFCWIINIFYPDSTEPEQIVVPDKPGFEPVFGPDGKVYYMIISAKSPKPNGSNSNPQSADPEPQKVIGEDGLPHYIITLTMPGNSQNPNGNGPEQIVIPDKHNMEPIRGPDNNIYYHMIIKNPNGSNPGEQLEPEPVVGLDGRPYWIIRFIFGNSPSSGGPKDMVVPGKTGLKPQVVGKDIQWITDNSKHPELDLTPVPGLQAWRLPTGQIYFTVISSLPQSGKPTQSGQSPKPSEKPSGQPQTQQGPPGMTQIKRPDGTIVYVMTSPGMNPTDILSKLPPGFNGQLPTNGGSFSFQFSSPDGKLPPGMSIPKEALEALSQSGIPMDALNGLDMSTLMGGGMTIPSVSGSSGANGNAQNGGSGSPGISVNGNTNLGLGSGGNSGPGFNVNSNTNLGLGSGGNSGPGFNVNSNTNLGLGLGGNSGSGLNLNGNANLGLGSGGNSGPGFNVNSNTNLGLGFGGNSGNYGNNGLGSNQGSSLSGSRPSSNMYYGGSNPSGGMTNGANQGSSLSGGGPSSNMYYGGSNPSGGMTNGANQGSSLSGGGPSSNMYYGGSNPSGGMTNGANQGSSLSGSRPSSNMYYGGSNPSGGMTNGANQGSSLSGGGPSSNMYYGGSNPSGGMTNGNNHVFYG